MPKFDKNVNCNEQQSDDQLNFLCRIGLHGTENKNMKERLREEHRSLHTSYSSIPIEQESGPRAAQSKTTRAGRKAGEGSRGIKGTQVR